MCLSGSWQVLGLSAWHCCSLQGEKKNANASMVSKLLTPHLYQISCSMASSPSQSANAKPIKSWYTTFQYKKQISCAEKKRTPSTSCTVVCSSTESVALQDSSVSLATEVTLQSANTMINIVCKTTDQQQLNCRFTPNSNKHYCAMTGGYRGSLSTFSRSNMLYWGCSMAGPTSPSLFAHSHAWHANQPSQISKAWHMQHTKLIACHFASDRLAVTHMITKKYTIYLS